MQAITVKGAENIMIDFWLCLTSEQFLWSRFTGDDFS